MKNVVSGACSMHSRQDSCIQETLVGRPDWKSPLGRPRLRWKDNIKIDVKNVD
jgi:hypothetical protein